MTDVGLHSMIPGLSAKSAELFISFVGGVAIVLSALMVAFGVRRALTVAGLRGPAPGTTGLDWARVAGLFVSFGWMAALAPLVLSPSTGAEVGTTVRVFLAVLQPVVSALFLLAAGDHFRRGLLEQAATSRGAERADLEPQEQRLRWGIWCVAAPATFGDGSWSAWPLLVGGLVIWARRDPVLRPAFDRTWADLRAGAELRKRTGWTEGEPLTLHGDPITLAGPIGWTHTRVMTGGEPKLVRNVVLRGAERLPDSEAKSLSAAPPV